MYLSAERRHRRRRDGVPEARRGCVSGEGIGRVLALAEGRRQDRPEESPRRMSYGPRNQMG